MAAAVLAVAATGPTRSRTVAVHITVAIAGRAAEVPESSRAARLALMHREFGDGPRYGRIVVGAGQRGANQLPMREPGVRSLVGAGLVVRSVRARIVITGGLGCLRRRRAARPVGYTGGRAACHVGEDLIVQLRMRRLLAKARLATAFEGVLDVACRAPSLTNDVFDNGDDRVVRHASLARAIIVYDVAETQRALLHSVLPKDFSSGSYALSSDSNSGRDLSGAQHSESDT
jgi:hypothetical protein